MVNSTVADEIISSGIAQHLEASEHISFDSVDATWVLLSAVLVFVMQIGFGLLEAGSIQSINSQSILFKNLLDVSFVTIGWWSFGYSISTNTGNGFSGDASNVFSAPSEKWTLLFFNWAFAATSATILSGAVSGRMRLSVYIMCSITMGWIVFPLSAHWVWASNGWLYKRGLIDFAGSGVVHLGGGVAALVGSIFVGPRSIRFEEKDGEGWVDHRPRGHSAIIAFIGGVLLWFGWFGFNAGSTLGVTHGSYIVAATCLFNSSLATSSAILSVVVYSQLFNSFYSLWDLLNAALGGLVAITAGCATVPGWGALIAGLIAGPLYKLSSSFLARLLIDDPVDAISVHGTCGVLGLLIPAFLSDQPLIDRAYGVDYVDFSVGEQLGIQLIGLVAFLALSGGIMVFLLGALNLLLGGVRVSDRDELVGNDYGYFGGYAYPDWEEMVRTAKFHDRRKLEIKRRKEKQMWVQLGQLSRLAKKGSTERVRTRAANIVTRRRSIMDRRSAKPGSLQIYVPRSPSRARVGSNTPNSPNTPPTARVRPSAVRIPNLSHNPSRGRIRASAHGDVNSNDFFTRTDFIGMDSSEEGRKYPKRSMLDSSEEGSKPSVRHTMRFAGYAMDSSEEGIKKSLRGMDNSGKSVSNSEGKTKMSTIILTL